MSDSLMTPPNFDSAPATLNAVAEINDHLDAAAARDPGMGPRAHLCRTAFDALDALVVGARYTPDAGRLYWERCRRALEGR